MTIRADVAVIGGGIAGASAAWHLATVGADVVLLEQEAVVGHHATGRSAAILSETSGDDSVCALAALSRPFFETPPPGFAAHPLVVPRGLLWIGRLPDGELLDDIAAIGTRYRPGAVHRLTSDQVLHVVAQLADEAIGGGGVHEVEALSIDVDALLHAYLRAVAGTSQRVHTSLALLQATRHGSTWTIRTPDCDVTCRYVVNAAGAWGDDVAARCGVEALGLTPLRRTAALAKSPVDVASWPLIMDAAGRFYLEPAAGGLLISPADEHPSEPCDAQAEELDVANALEHVSNAIGVPLRSIRRAWAGLRTFCSDRRPAIGPDPRQPSFIWMVGQGGGGIKTSPAMGALVASHIVSEDAPRWITDAATLVAALRPDRLC